MERLLDNFSHTLQLTIPGYPGGEVIKGLKKIKLNLEGDLVGLESNFIRCPNLEHGGQGKWPFLHGG